MAKRQAAHGVAAKTVNVRFAGESSLKFFQLVAKSGVTTLERE
jgi:hypothetical protein